jgi:hypothetical protein
LGLGFEHKTQNSKHKTLYWVTFAPMEPKLPKRSIRPIILIFVFTTALLIAGRSFLDRWNIDQEVMIWGNLLLFAVTLLSFYIYTRSFGSKNAYAITRGMYASVLARMFICVVAVFIYVSIVGRGVNKGAVFGCMFLYFVYTGAEVAILMKMSKHQKNA